MVLNGTSITCALHILLLSDSPMYGLALSNDKIVVTAKDHLVWNKIFNNYCSFVVFKAWLIASINFRLYVEMKTL